MEDFYGKSRYQVAVSSLKIIELNGVFHGDLSNRHDGTRGFHPGNEDISPRSYDISQGNHVPFWKSVDPEKSSQGDGDAHAARPGGCIFRT